MQSKEAGITIPAMGFLVAQYPLQSSGSFPSIRDNRDDFVIAIVERNHRFCRNHIFSSFASASSSLFIRPYLTGAGSAGGVCRQYAAHYCRISDVT